MGCSFRKRKPNKIWVDKGSQFSNSSFKKWLEDNEIRMYSTFNEKKFVVAEIFIRTYKKRFTSIRQTLQKCVNVLNDTVDKYSNTYHNTIKMKPIDVKSNYYTNTMLILMKKILSFKLVIMQEFQNIKTFLLKDMLLIYQKKFL